MQSLYLALSGRKAARICDTIKEQLSIDFVYKIFTIFFPLGYQ